MKNSIRSIGMLLALITLTMSLDANAATPQDQEKSCAKFVQDFYSWYAATMNRSAKEGPKSNADGEIQKRENQEFSPELLRDLKIDSEAAAKVPEEIVGLDFDPVLNAQDVAQRYVVGKINKKNSSLWVEVYGYWNGKKGARPDVVPELALNNGKWTFVNFHYSQKAGQNDDLLSVLKALRKERQDQANSEKAKH